MFTPETSRHFTPHADPITNVTSYVLSTKLAPLQQSFYFSNPSMTKDARYLWFYCAFPPAGSANYGRTLGLLDFETDELIHFPDSQFLDASPLVDEDTGEIYFCNYEGIFRRKPERDAPLERIFLIPDDFPKGVMNRLATHLTFSPDKRFLGIDAEIGDRWIGGLVHIESGAFTKWYERDYCFNHLQINPTDGSQTLMAEDFWSNKSTGDYNIIRTREDGVFQRLWTQRMGEEPRLWPVLEDQKATHEWWSQDGRHFNYCRYGKDGNNGIVRVRIADGWQEMRVPLRAWHGHCNLDDTLYVFDENDGFWRGCESRVGFFNHKTKKHIYIVSKNPALYTREEPSRYHIDPHPQFTAGGRYIAFTTTVRGQVDFALCPVQALVEATR